MSVRPPQPTFIPAAHHGGPQTKLKWIVLHSTVSPCRAGEAQAIAMFFHNQPKDTNNPTSAHYTVDPYERRQCVGDNTIAYHCGYNNGSIAIEMCEIPTQDITRWDDTNHRLLEINSAHLVARLCAAYNIRPYYVGAVGLKLGVKGVTTHAQMSKAFRVSNHWDPGAWRRFRFMREVRKHYNFLLAKDAKAA